jgi:hypothetical protein
MSSLANAYVVVQARQLRGENNFGFGIAFRGSASTGELYYFAISSNGEWAFQESFTSGPSTNITPWTSTSAINQGLGASNTLAVRYKGTSFTFYINNVQVGTAQDNALSTGLVGVWASGGQEVVFNNFSVSEP